MPYYKAFTLIELLIVVVIICILACLAMPILDGITISAKFNQMFIDVSHLEKYINLKIIEGTDESAEYGWVKSDEWCRQRGYDALQENPYFYYKVARQISDMPPGEYYYDISIYTKGPGEDLVDNSPCYVRFWIKTFPVPTVTKTWFIIDQNHPWSRYLHIEGATHIGRK